MVKSSTSSQNNVIEQLRREIFSLNGLGKFTTEDTGVGLGIIETVFPNQVFPIGAIHEFTSKAFSHVAATNGFITGIAGSLMKKGGACLWVSTKRTVFPASLQFFGIAPERIIFIDERQTKQALWAIEEGLKCASLAAVIGELSDLTFTQSRRLQLAVEQSHVTGFIHRIGAKAENNLACVSRWQITPIASELDGLPGVGHPRWNVRLVKVRNGLPGNWQLEWSDKGFTPITVAPAIDYVAKQRKAG